MRQSQLFGRTSKTLTKDAVSASHELLVRAGFINQLTSGVWSFLPLGRMVYKNIEEIVRQSLNAIGCQEVSLPSLIPSDLWKETDRWTTMDPPLFKVKDRHEKWYGLGSTHEEVIADLARKYIFSYKDLPQALYQIQNKFRNEVRATGGLLRTREFMMKDLYSFHETQEDLDIFYQKVRDTYCHILESFNLSVVVVEAHSGSIGGSRSQEFMVLSETGEDDIVCCLNCRIGFNKEVGSQKNKCDICGQDLVPKKAIEVGHIFQLDTIYSEKMKAFFTDQKGAKKPIIMGCYGLGLPRILATIVEVHHDQNGIKWPEKASPFLCHLLSFRQEEASKKVYDLLQKNKINVLWDDRDLSAGEKMKDSDLIGIPYRLIISDKTKGRIEYKKRGDSEVKLLSPEEILELF